MKIKKGWHYGLPFPFPKLLLTKSYVKNIAIKFDETARYDIDTDQTDINKLFGFSYGFHHTNSDRIGWRYVPTSDKIELLLYSYVDTLVYKRHLCFININDLYYIGLKVIPNKLTKKRNIYTTIINMTTIGTAVEIVQTNRFRFKFTAPWYALRYTLGLYFGGNRTAPHTIYIK